MHYVFLLYILLYKTNKIQNPNVLHTIVGKLQNKQNITLLQTSMGKIAKITRFTENVYFKFQKETSKCQVGIFKVISMGKVY